MTRFSSASLVAGLLLASVATLNLAQAADKADQPRTRAEVLAELAQARANGEMNFADQEVMQTPRRVHVQAQTAFAANAPATTKTPSTEAKTSAQ
ncbi:MAG TPA: DUF4148 domain-containing protein [Ideonella sp.]|uniref:DUF4148 domain-containing protein n=1 Tax=Ideonella sp. TaxID=1929293 RepID=UPI002CD652E5|nr:DUF4148 domain-containing protein [Ideonella sp.]HSI51985.1 DUF4148 domain-containing protein [Ideonella sp.]